MLATGLINVSEIFLAERALHRGAFGYGLLWTATGAGLVVGSLVSGALLETRDLTDVYPLAFLPWAAGISRAPPSRRTSGSLHSPWWSRGSGTG